MKSVFIILFSFLSIIIISSDWELVENPGKWQPVDSDDIPTFDCSKRVGTDGQVRVVRDEGLSASQLEALQKVHENIRLRGEISRWKGDVKWLYASVKEIMLPLADFLAQRTMERW